MNRSGLHGDQTIRTMKHVPGVNMRCSAVLAVPLLLATLALPAAAADDPALCNDTRGDAEDRLAACSAAVASRQWTGADLARLYTSRAFLLQRKRDFDRALDDLNSAIRADSGHAPAYRGRGAVYYEYKDYDRSIRDQEQALRINPKFAGAFYERGRAYARKHDYDRAVADFNEAIRISPNYANPYNGRGLIFHDRGQFDNAIADFSEAIRLDPKYVAAYYNRSRSFLRKRAFDRALADAQETVRIDPNYVAGHGQLGYILKDMREFDRALAAFSTALRLDPNAANALIGRGNVLVDKKDYSRAIAEFNSALKIEPANARAWADRARAYNLNGDLDQALEDVNESLKLEPRSASALNTRALVLHAKREYDSAIADFTEAIRIDPAYAPAYTNRGRTYNASKEFDRALKDLNESIRLNPDSTFGYWNRAISYENKRQLDRALADWRTSLRLDPTNQNAVKAIRRLEQEMASTGAPRIRVALVIGNADYQYGGRLANPVNDATDIANALRKIGFDVIEGRNLDKRAMEQKIQEFGRKLERASVALFFYAGHGMQVGGDNQLVPVDARFQSAADLKAATIDLTQVIAKMEADQRVNLIFLDACRDNPLGRAPGLAQPKGLAPIQNSVGTLTAFATKPHHVAFDGTGRNSPFTTALLKHMPTPGLEIGAVMKRVRSEVIQATGGKQVPFDESSLITDVVMAQ